MTKKAFTLVELLIVVSILGILGAIVFPEFQTQIQQSRETAAKDNIRILRNAIELYAAQHNDIPPGYVNGDPAQGMGQIAFYEQLVVDGNYLSEAPRNPLNNSITPWFIADADAFPAEPIAGSNYGWVYQPATRTIKLNYSGTDSEGVSYFDY